MKFPISDLRRVSPFKDVFPINAEIVKRLSEDIKKNGYVAILKQLWFIVNHYCFFYPFF